MSMLNLRERDLKKNTKESWNRLLREKITNKNKDDLVQKAKSYKKVDFIEIRDTEPGMSEFFKTMTLKDCRTKFALLVQTTDGIKTHRMSSKENVKTLWECPEKGCTMTDGSFHIKICESYESIRSRFNNLETEEDELHYFQEVLRKRNEAHMNDNA